MLNQFTLIGRITREPQLQTTRQGISYARFTLAVRKSYKKRTGNYDTDFIQLVSWSKVAENVADYCAKGSLISVRGRLQMRSFELKNHKRITVPDIVADEVIFLHIKKPDVSSSHQQPHIPQDPSTRQQPSDPEDKTQDENMPGEGG